MNRTFFQQLFYTIFLLVLLSVVLYAGLTIGIVKRALNRETLERQMAMTHIVANMVPPEGFESDQDAQVFSERIVKDTITRLSLINADGTVIADTSKDKELLNDHSDRPEIRQAWFRGAGSASRYSTSLSQTMLYTAVYLENLNLVVRLSQSVEQVRSDLDRIYGQIMIIFFIILGIGTGFAVWMARSLTGTLSSVRQVVGEYSKGNFAMELDLSGSREAVVLSRSVNSMGRQLQDKISTITYQKNELRGMLNSMHEPVILLNHRLEVKEMNPAAVNLLLKDPDYPYLGKGFLQVIRSVEACELAEKTLREETSHESLIYFREKDIYLQTYSSYLFRDEDTPPSVLLVMNDITRIKKIGEMRKEFVANVSHELRTPVTSIMGYVETLKEGALENREKSREFVEIIYRQTRNLNALIDDLLTLSRIEDGRSRFKMETFPLCDLLSSAVSLCLTKANEKKSCIELNCSSKEIHAHPVLLEQAVTNLIENAVKYSPEGSRISVRGMVEPELVRIEIQDNGPGIPQKDLDRIFERFYRVDKARSRDMGGTGLGLAIVKHICIMHGGTVAVTSREGQGCLFTITIPRAETSSRDQKVLNR